MTDLSSSVSAPSIVSSTFLPRSRARSCTRRRNFSKVERIGIMRIFIEFSRKDEVSRSISSETDAISTSSRCRAISLKRACTVTSSPTRFTNRSSLAAGTRRLEALSGAS